MKIAQLLCIEDVVIYGRNADGSPDYCFAKDKEYLFCVDERQPDKVFIINDVYRFHWFYLHDPFAKNFELISIQDESEFDLDEITLHRMRRVYKERHDYEEDVEL